MLHELVLTAEGENIWQEVEEVYEPALLFVYTAHKNTELHAAYAILDGMSDTLLSISPA